MKLFIGNKAYSSWSMRGWLACRLSGVPFEEVVVPMFNQDWDKVREGDEFAPSSGKVPILWDGEDCVVWDSLAIVEYLNEKTDNQKFWPVATDARAMARSMAAEMHSGYAALRRECPMNIRRIHPAGTRSDEVKADVDRILHVWAEARARYGKDGDFLFGDFGAADIMFAPVVTRLISYSIPVPRFAQAYMQSIIAHPMVQDWIGAAQAEDWIIDKYEDPSKT